MSAGDLAINNSITATGATVSLTTPAGKVQEAVNASNKARHDAVSKRKEVLLGTNQFPNFNEKAGEKNPVEAQCCCSGNSCEKPIATLNFNRAASLVEGRPLRHGADAPWHFKIKFWRGNSA